jgi:hypothetical protein
MLRMTVTGKPSEDSSPESNTPEGGGWKKEGQCKQNFHGIGVQWIFHDSVL